MNSSSTIERPYAGSYPQRSRWQFRLRSIFALTTIASALMAMLHYFPALPTVLGQTALGLIWVAVVLVGMLCVAALLLVGLAVPAAAIIVGMTLLRRLTRAKRDPWNPQQRFLFVTFFGPLLAGSCVPLALSGAIWATGGRGLPEASVATCLVLSALVGYALASLIACWTD